MSLGAWLALGLFALGVVAFWTACMLLERKRK